MVSLLWRYGIAMRIKHCIRGTQCSGIIYEEVCNNLVKTNVSGKNCFAANPTGSYGGSGNTFAESSTGNATFNTRGNYSRESMQNLAKTNVSSRIRFVANPTRTNPRIPGPFAESNTGVTTTMDLQ